LRIGRGQHFFRKLHIMDLHLAAGKRLSVEPRLRSLLAGSNWSARLIVAVPDALLPTPPPTSSGTFTRTPGWRR
jgi:hypothetical protein